MAAVEVSERTLTVSAGVSLTTAPVVVSGGRGVGSAEGFAVIEELAALLGGAVGCSRAVTSAGWRPHSDQVGQTGTKVSPDLYIACGISGATQHMAGCKGAKKLLAINPDGEASIFAGADYGVIGDLHEVVPAISAELRKARGVIASLPAAVAARRCDRAQRRALRPPRCSGLVAASSRARAADRARDGDVPQRVRNEADDRPRPAQAAPATRAGADARLHLLGLPGARADDRDRDDRRSSTATRPSRGSAHQGWYALLVDVFCVLVLGRRARRALDPQGAAAPALRGQPPRRGRPDPRR